MAESWYALRCKPQKELTVWHQADSRGFETFFPFLKVNPVNPRSRRIRPYFPGYLFIKIDLAEVGVSTFQFMPYTMGLVSFGGEPARVAEPVILELQNKMECIGREGIKPASRFKKGDRVRVTRGLFEGYRAIFDQTLSGEDRVRVLLQMLADRSLHLELSTAELEPLGESSARHYLQ